MEINHFLRKLVKGFCIGSANRKMKHDKLII